MVMMIPKIMGTKSPIRLMDGINSMGKDSKISTIAITNVAVIILGRAMCAIFLFLCDVSTSSTSFYLN